MLVFCQGGIQFCFGDLICCLICLLSDLQLSSMQYLQQTHRECLFPASTPQCSIRRRHVLVRAAQAADTVKVFYRTNWGSAKLHGSLQGAAWKDFDLKKVRHPQCTSMTHAVHPLQPTQALQRLATSHMPALCYAQVTSAPGKWLSTSIPVNGSSSSSSTPLLEFVVNDGGSQWDKPAAGEANYVTQPLACSQQTAAAAQHTC